VKFESSGWLVRVVFAVASGIVLACAPVAPATAASPTIAEAVAVPESTAPVSPTPPQDATPPTPATVMTLPAFLDRLMMAESGGRTDARNPRSTAVGPYQFIESTWLDLARRILPAETAALSPAQILALRSDPAFARRGAEAYTNENAATLKANGFEATFPRLRLAFLLGPQGAIRVLQAPPQTRVTQLLGPAVAKANPFMFGLTAEGLIARAARDIAVPATTSAGIAAGDVAPSNGAAAGKPKAPRVTVRCNLELPACRRWQSLALARVPAVRGPRKQVAAVKSR